MVFKYGLSFIGLCFIERNEIEHMLNTLRNDSALQAERMMEVGYAKLLEREAQTWADTCNFYHDDPYYRFLPGRYTVGQTIYIGKNMSWSDVFSVWAEERRQFTYDKTNDKALVGNYTQIIYEGTQQVGCGKALCGGLHYYVCNFAPSILDSQINKPYEKGIAGNGCRGHFSNETNSMTNLCSCVGKFCTNGGTLNLTTCDCQCVPGVKTFDDHICELNCTQGGDHADCSSLKEDDCKTDSMTPFKCPWLCNVCPYGGKHYIQNSVPMPWETTTTSATTPVVSSTIKRSASGATTVAAATTASAPTGSVTTASQPRGATPATRASELLVAVYVLCNIGLLM